MFCEKITWHFLTQQSLIYHSLLNYSVVCVFGTAKQTIFFREIWENRVHKIKNTNEIKIYILLITVPIKQLFQSHYYCLTSQPRHVLHRSQCQEVETMKIIVFHDNCNSSNNNIFAQPCKLFLVSKSCTEKMTRLKWDSRKIKIRTNKKKIKSTVPSKSIQIAGHLLSPIANQ